MTCPFCGLDPYEYVNVGIGSVPVAVNCCEEGVSLYHGEDFQDLATAWMAGARAMIERFQNALIKIGWNKDGLDATGLSLIAIEALDGPPITVEDDNDSPF